MTDLLEQRLRSAMSPPDSVDPTGSSSADASSTDGGSTDGRSGVGGASELERWSRIEAAAQRRKDRSDLGQRVAMVASVCLVAGSALALGSGSLFGSTEAGGGPGTDSEVGGSTDHTIWRWLFVLGLTVAVGNGIARLWRRIPDWYFSFEPSPTGRWGRTTGTMLVAVGLALPLWATISFLSRYDGVSYVDSGREWLPLATVTGFTLVALGAFLGWRGTSVGSRLGALLLGVSALQAGLALQALLRVNVLFDKFDQAIDNTRSDPDFNAFRRQVGDAGGDLYPIGSGSLIFLLLPWIAGSILVFESKPRARAWSISLGLAATVATWVTFQSMDSDFMNLID